jgi:hypothetical protein
MSAGTARERRNPGRGRGFEGGRYWARTSDLRLVGSEPGPAFFPLRPRKDWISRENTHPRSAPGGTARYRVERRTTDARRTRAAYHLRAPHFTHHSLSPVMTTMLLSGLLIGSHSWRQRRSRAAFRTSSWRRHSARGARRARRMARGASSPSRRSWRTCSPPTWRRVPRISIPSSSRRRRRQRPGRGRRRAGPPRVVGGACLLRPRAPPFRRPRRRPLVRPPAFLRRAADRRGAASARDQDPPQTRLDHDDDGPLRPAVPVRGGRARRRARHQLQRRARQRRATCSRRRRPSRRGARGRLTARPSIREPSHPPRTLFCQRAG